jgi:NAD(P)-dependent dehydrogenase (short-subunit alcohol dehydrogenase family)
VTWDIAGKVVLITGANTGIGRVTALRLAERGARIVIAGRSEERTRPVLDAITSGGGKADFLELDLGSLDSVRACADAFVALGLPLHVLIANAGLAGSRGITRDGFEIHFGCNHLGHFLLTCRLRELLVASAPGRVVVVASKAHRSAKGIDFEAVGHTTKTFTGVPEYQVSKLANVLFAAKLAKVLAGTGVTSYSLHPGVVASDVWRRIPQPFRWLVTRNMITNDEGALTSLHCACAPELESESGGYYDKSARAEPSAVARDERLATVLWEKSEAWTGCRF